MDFVPIDLNDLIVKLKAVKCELSRLARGEQFLRGGCRISFKEEIRRAHCHVVMALDDCEDFLIEPHMVEEQDILDSLDFGKSAEQHLRDM